MSKESPERRRSASASSIEPGSGAPAASSRPAVNRSLAGSIAANTRWAHEPNPVAATRAAREGLKAKFSREVDPAGTMEPQELEKRVRRLKRAHFQRMALVRWRKAVRDA